VRFGFNERPRDLPGMLVITRFFSTHFSIYIFLYIYCFYYSTTYNTNRDYNTNNVDITYEANYKKY